MAISRVQMVSISLPPPLENRNHLVQNRAGFKGFQVKSKIVQQPPLLHLPRRDVLACITTTLASSFLLMDPAEARNVKPETRRKIREKLDKIRKKAGVAKDKEDSGSSEKEKNPVPFTGLTAPLVEANI